MEVQYKRYRTHKISASDIQTVHTVLDSRILDLNAEISGVNMEGLMDNAGRAVANLVSSLKPKKILTVCGGGNNGGDGYVAASILKKEGQDIDCYPASPPVSELCKKKYAAYVKNGGRVIDSVKKGKYDVIVDALLGVGITGPPREPYASLIDLINESGAKVVSVDVPSGFPSNHYVKPQFTVTMQFRKDGMTKSNSGKIVVADVGFPLGTIEMIGPGDLIAFPSSLKSSHKGENGICVLVGGSIRYFGAPIYMACSALRMGPDLVNLYTPSSIHNHVASNCQGIILRKSGIDQIEFNYDLMKVLNERADSLAIGPGISKVETALEEAAKIIDFTLSIKKSLVIDADALEASRSITDFKGTTVLTPHRGEFKSVFGIDPTEDNVMRVARKINAIILLKGEVDIVTDGETLKKNISYHHQSMTRGGTGDLVTGAVAGLLARRLDPMHSATLASYIVGQAGLNAFGKMGDGYMISDLIDSIPEVLVSGIKKTS
ncbi:MAG: NAD(P)H-hydrate dehydratase [Thermoplasmatales archaeon]|nr:NAD(P)H-hydrate dehydratase [Thermoplasmatales archaeon]